MDCVYAHDWIDTYDLMAYNTMQELANLYLNGDDKVDPDPEKAVYWFTRLAERDNSDAQFNLGLHYAKGHGVERDFSKAVYWMERAAESGDQDAPALAEKGNQEARKILNDFFGVIENMDN